MGVTDDGGVDSVQNEPSGGGDTAVRRRLIGVSPPAARFQGREEAQEREGGTANLVR